MSYMILPMFRRASLALLLSVFVTGLAGADAPRTVDSVDLERYMGRWYEIAALRG